MTILLRNTIRGIQVPLCTNGQQGNVTAPHFNKCMTGMLGGAGLIRQGVVMIHDDHSGYATHISTCRGNRTAIYYADTLNSAQSGT